MTSKEQYLIDNFKLELPIVKTISEIGRIARTHKYDVWIAKEFKKDKNVLSIQRDLFFIIDWAKATNPDITRLSFKEALEQSKVWHASIKYEPVKIKNPHKLDEDRIIFSCKDNKHFFLLLTPEELKQEGSIMNHCVGGFDYKSKVNQGYSLIVSLRDEKNEPHVTMEIDTKTCNVVQIYGKANSVPKKEYLKMLSEFAIYASGVEEEKDEDLINLINLNFEKFMN